MARGGRREGAGRKAGCKSKATIEKEEFGRAVAQEAAADGQSPLEYMLGVMRDTTAAQTRRDAMAVAAAPFLHARLASSTVVSDNKHVHAGNVSKSCFDDFLREAIEAAGADAEGDRPGERS